MVIFSNCSLSLVLRGWTTIPPSRTPQVKPVRRSEEMKASDRETVTEIMWHWKSNKTLSVKWPNRAMIIHHGKLVTKIDSTLCAHNFKRLWAEYIGRCFEIVSSDELISDLDLLQLGVLNIFLSALPPLLGLAVLRGLRVSVWWGLEWISHIDLLNLKDLRGVDLTSPWDVRNRTTKYLRLPGCNVRCRFNTCHLVLVSHCWWVRCVEIVIIWRIDLRFRSTTAWRAEYY